MSDKRRLSLEWTNLTETVDFLLVSLYDEDLDQVGRDRIFHACKMLHGALGVVIDLEHQRSTIVSNKNHLS